MRKEDAVAFRNLENCHDSINLFGILMTNGQPIDFEEGDELLSYEAIGKMGSRINHRYCF